MTKVFCFVYLLCSLQLYAQIPPDSSASQLKEVVIRAYLREQTLYTLPASVAYIDQRQFKDQLNYSLVPAMNTVAGVRMEERSPGSYRLSIRGSLLRSPFGIRNVKVYMAEFPLTDAGGNTYLNLLDMNSIGSIEILKGPDGSLFGANSGGVVLLHPQDRMDSSTISAGITGGSYGLFLERVALQKRWNNYDFSIKQAFQRSDGYRENSALKRHYIQTTQHWRYAKRTELSCLLFYSNLNYETPAGLTLAQWNQNPRQARPATATLPGAVEQQAAVYNQTVFGGLSNETRITNRLRNVLAVFASHTDFENPFITNYEKRKENTYGLRTYFELKDKNRMAFHWKVNLGLEWQRTQSEIRNYGNNHGIADTVQSEDAVNARQYFYFTRGVLYFWNRLSVEGAVSLNHYKNEYGASGTALSDRAFTPQYTPRLAMSYIVTRNLVARASISKGYSPPTIQEIRGSDQLINTGLQPEYAWNYETGIRFQSTYARAWGDVSVFYYQLQNAIVRRLNDAGEEYFINAGGTKQAGFELQWNTWLIKENRTMFIRSLLLRNSYTYYHFRFSNYQNASTDYSGNNITGVPDHVVVVGLHTDLPKRFYVFAQYYYTSRIPLNDANQEYANSYHLVQLKAGWRHSLFRSDLELFAGCDNLLDQKYSLGNDLNAAGGRYYNAAPLRNFYGGVNVSF